MSYSYSITYKREDGTTGGVMGGREGLLDTISGCNHDIEYYRQLGYTVAVDYVVENCPDCKGEGDRAHRTNKFKRIKCKRCKGAGTIQNLKGAA
jgi:DnaJ-class molecular chaperone